jgi:tetratricopeptide (TPR) repeat protein
VLIQDRESIHNLFPLSDLLKSDRPFLLLTLSLNYQFAQLDTTTYHLVNIGIHIAAALTLFSLVRFALKYYGGQLQQHSDLIAFGAALLWAVHPLQTQSVTYLVQRGESLCGLFYLLCLSSAVHICRSKKPQYHSQLLLVLYFLLGVFTKAVIITAPISILIWDKLVARSSWKEIARKRSPMYVGMVIASCLFGSHICSIHERITAAGVGTSEHTTTPIEYLGTQSEIILHYIQLSFWPSHLCIDYHWPVQHNVGTILLTGTIILTLLAGSLYAFRKHPGIGFVSLLFFLILAPTSSVLPINDLAFEHRMYLSLASLSTLTVILVVAVLDKVTACRRLTQRLTIGCLLLAGLALTARTYQRNLDYVHPIRLWSSTLDISPRNHRAMTNLGVAYAAADQHLDAIEQYQKALAINPEYSFAYFNLSDSLRLLNRNDEALRTSQKLVEVEPQYDRGHFQIGALHEKMRDFERAQQLYRNVIEINPKHAVAHYNLARLCERGGEPEQAMLFFETAIQLAPRDARFVEGYGNFFGRQGNFARAIEQYELVIARDASYANVYFNFAHALRMLGRSDQAIVQLKRGARLFPGDRRFREQIARIRKTLSESST